MTWYSLKIAKFLSKGKKFQALTSVGQRRMIMRRVNLEKMEKKGRREGVSSVHVLVGHSWLELLPDDVYFIFGFLNYGIGSSRDLMLYMVNFVNILSCLFCLPRMPYRLVKF